MVISDEQLEAFRKIYKDHYGREISKEDGYEQAVKLITMMKVIYKPMSNEEWLEVKKELKRRGITLNDAHK